MKHRVPQSLLVSFVLAAGLLVMSSTPAGAVTSGANGRVLFTSDRGGSTQIYSERYDGTAVVQLTSLGSNFDASYNGDGSRITFISTRNGSNQLFIMGADGSSQTLVTTTGLTPSHPSWAPNNSAIAFAGLKGTDSDIYTVKQNGTGLIDLTPDLTNFDNDPSWSPGGMTIAFDRTDASGNVNVWTILQTGTGLKQLTTSNVDSNPSWSPDNKNLVFQSARDAVTGPVPFATLTMPVGMAWTANSLLVTQQRKDKVSAVSPSGVVTTFATLPATGNADLERYIAVSPGLGGFPAGYVYVSVRQNILQITPDGLTVTTFATCSNLPNSNNFLTFDQVGTFGFQLVVVGGQSAIVDTVSSTGTCTAVANLHSQTAELEGAEVAPLSWAPFGGDLITASKFDNTVYAIASSGNVFSAVGPWDTAEQALFVPAAICNWSTSGGAFFTNDEATNTIYKFSANSFPGLAGQPAALVTSEGAQGIGQFTSNGTSIDITTLVPPFGTADMEASAFAGGCTAHSSGGSGTTGSLLPREIYKMTSAGLSQTRLTTNATDDTRPAWSPDGASIVFQSDRDDPSQPGCEATLTCKYEIYSMSATDGTGQTNISNDVAFNDISPDWETISFSPIVVDDFSYTPSIAKPKEGGTVLWEFYSDHTVTDNSSPNMGLFDSGILDAGQFFVFNFQVAGQYPVHCTIHSQMTMTVKVPMKVAPASGNLTTVFTITWGANTAALPPGYVTDVQIERPGGTFVDWKTGVTIRNATFTPDGGTGTYLFQARLRNTANLGASNYSAPISIIVNP